MLGLISQPITAHQLSTGYIIANLDQSGRITGEWQLGLTDLELVLGLDVDQNGELTWGEVTNRRADIASYLAEHMHINRGQFSCTTQFQGLERLEDHADAVYAVTDFSAQCPLTGTLNIDYSAIFDKDDSHEVVVNISDKDNTQSFVLRESQQSIDVDLADGSGWITFKEFVHQGIIHILIGTDHILFLLALLLPCVLIRKDGQWQRNPELKRVLSTTIWIVSAFTLAHSVTLTATAIGWIVPSSRWVEFGIAVSVLFAALNNVKPLIIRLGWLTFCFGLLHGMGFAGVLGELGLPADQKLLSIVAFNLGVEIGQLAIVLVALPVLIMLGKTVLYRRWLMPAASIGIALVALNWVVERF
ncbi:HupE/UreJ family protein [Paraglaciecola sp. L1A13]|uniref:HupE/UreJ family protein n=1 Tax=Paraglaciecola sp. L1A13 TaxID=2686359 RepID=UPI00351A8E4B|tara:strand:+ start:325 stop:1401 length:1077 start_codon:yes stop_codon:yes gene_type:complete